MRQARQRLSRQMLTARQVVAETLRKLPDDLRQAARPCVIELCNMADVEDELLDPELLGLFEGCSRLDGEPQTPADLPRLRLFLDNLWDFAGSDPLLFRDEVRTTLLHELGHYLGLNEDEVEALGLA